MGESRIVQRGRLHENTEITLAPGVTVNRIDVDTPMTPVIHVITAHNKEG